MDQDTREDPVTSAELTRLGQCDAHEHHELQLHPMSISTKLVFIPKQLGPMSSALPKYE